MQQKTLQLPSKGWKILQRRDKREVVYVNPAMGSGKVLVNLGAAKYDAEDLLKAGSSFHAICAMTPDLERAMLTIVGIAQRHSVLLQAMDEQGDLARAIMAFRIALADAGVKA